MKKELYGLAGGFQLYKNDGFTIRHFCAVAIRHDLFQ